MFSMQHAARCSTVSRLKCESRESLILMSQVSLTIRVGKKYAIYLPKRVVEMLDISEGDTLLLSVKGRTLVLKPLRRTPARPWGTIEPEEVEAVGEELSRRFFG